MSTLVPPTRQAAVYSDFSQLFHVGYNLIIIYLTIDYFRATVHSSRQISSLDKEKEKKKKETKSALRLNYTSDPIAAKVREDISTSFLYSLGLSYSQ